MNATVPHHAPSRATNGQSTPSFIISLFLPPSQNLSLPSSLSPSQNNHRDHHHNISPSPQLSHVISLSLANFLPLSFAPSLGHLLPRISFSFSTDRPIGRTSFSLAKLPQSTVVSITRGRPRNSRSSPPLTSRSPSVANRLSLSLTDPSPFSLSFVLFFLSPRETSLSLIRTLFYLSHRDSFSLSTVSHSLNLLPVFLVSLCFSFSFLCKPLLVLPLLLSPFISFFSLDPSPSLAFFFLSLSPKGVVRR